MAEQIKTVFDFSGNDATVFGRIARGMDGLNRQASAAQSSFRGLLGPALGFIGVGYGVHSFAEKLKHVWEEADKATDSITAAYITSNRFAGGVNGMDAVAASAKKAGEAFQFVEQMASRGIAPTETYASIMQTISSPLLARTKASMADIAKFTENIVPVMAAVSGSTAGAANAAHSLAFIMQTGFGRPPRELLLALKMSNKEFKDLQKKGAGPLFDELQKRTSKLAPQFKALFDEPGIKMQQLKNRVDGLFLKMSEPVMEAVNEGAKELLEFFNQHEDSLKRMAKTVGSSLTTGIKVAVSWAKNLVQYLNGGQLVAGAVGLALAPKALSIAASLPGWISTIGGGVIAMSTSMYGFASKLATQGALTLMGMTGWLPKLNTVGGSFAALMAGGAAMMGKMLLTAGMWIGGIALAAAAGYAIGTAFDRLTGASDKLAGLLEKIDPLGIMAAGRVREEEGVKAHQERLASVKEKRAETMAVLEAEYIKKGYDTARAHGMAVYSADHGQILEGPAAPLPEFKKGFKPDKTNVHNDFRNSKFDIKQTFAEGFDPDRIAVAFTQDLVMLGERRLSSGLGPIYSSP